jgi:hypothetical protein
MGLAYNLAAFLTLALAILPNAHATDIKIIPTLPPGIWSVVSSGGLSAINTKTGTYTIGGNTTSFYISSLLLIPFLIAVVVLDFGIFGAYATRKEDLNPISKLVYNVRERYNNRQGSSDPYDYEDRKKR